jgi:S-adenosylmethionine synthetase
LVRKCTVQLSYAIGLADPTSIYIDSFGTHRCDLAVLQQTIYQLFPVKPQAIIEAFGLKRPIYFPTASYGHFSKNSYPWEVLDTVKLDALRQLISIEATQNEAI